MGRKKIYDDRTKYINDWIADNYDRINLKMNKGLKPDIRGFARFERISTNEFILARIMFQFLSFPIQRTLISLALIFLPSQVGFHRIPVEYLKIPIFGKR